MALWITTNRLPRHLITLSRRPTGALPEPRVNEAIARVLAAKTAALCSVSTELTDGGLYLSLWVSPLTTGPMTSAEAATRSPVSPRRVDNRRRHGGDYGRHICVDRHAEVAGRADLVALTASVSDRTNAKRNEPRRIND